MTEPTTCCRVDGNYCDRWDVLVGLDGLRVIAVERRGRNALTVTVEFPPGPVGCPGCGVLAIGHGRAPVPLMSAPAWAGRSGCSGASADSAATFKLPDREVKFWCFTGNFGGPEGTRTPDPRSLTRRRHLAISSASTTISAVMRSEIDQPTMRLD